MSLFNGFTDIAKKEAQMRMLRSNTITDPFLQGIEPSYISLGPDPKEVVYNPTGSWGITFFNSCL